MSLPEHKMLYQAGIVGLGRTSSTSPHWYCSCGRWSFTAKYMSRRKTGNNQIEADRSFQDHLNLQSE